MEEDVTAPLKVGLVGLGTIAQRGILPHLALDDARQWIDLHAVCDLDAERARAIAAEYGVPHTYATLDELLSDAEIEAVVLATPIPAHHAQTLSAIAAGKHVYVQKTMTVTAAEAGEVIAAADAAGVVLAASPGQMLSPGYARIRDLLAEGRIGQPYWAVANTAYVGHEHDAQVDPSWYYRAGGGPMYDMGVYSLHALTGILGPVRRVTAMSGIGLPTRQWRDQTIPVEMDDNTILLLDFGSARFAVAGSQYCDSGQALSWGFLGIYGSGGAIEVTELEPGSAHARQFAIRSAALGDQVELAERDQDDPHLAMPESHVWLDLRDFAEAIAAGRAPRAGAAHARHVIEIIEQGYAAARTGQAQDLQTTF